MAGTLRLEKWVRMMADHSSTGVWLSVGTMAEPDELPVSSQLHARNELMASSVSVGNRVAMQPGRCEGCDARA